MKSIGGLLQAVVIVPMFFLAAVLFFSLYNNPWGLKAFAVTSGSMAPTIKAGSLVFTTRSDSYKVDDIITFMHGRSESATTHRVVETQLAPSADNDVEYTYSTKGDANEEADFNTVNESQVTGKVRLAIPYLGYPLLWAKSQLGYILLIIIPATIIVYSELLNIKSEVAVVLKKRKNKGKITTLADI